MASSSKPILPFTRSRGFVILAAKNHFSDASTRDREEGTVRLQFSSCKADVHHSRSRLTGYCKHFSHQRMPNGTVVLPALKRGGF